MYLCIRGAKSKKTIESTSSTYFIYRNNWCNSRNLVQMSEQSPNLHCTKNRWTESHEIGLNYFLVLLCQTALGSKIFYQHFSIDGIRVAFGILVNLHGYFSIIALKMHLYLFFMISFETEIFSKSLWSYQCACKVSQKLSRGSGNIVPLQGIFS